MAKKKKKQMYFLLVTGILIIVVALFTWGAKNEPNPELKIFAQCLEANGAKFYGTFWCPHCNAQKEIFGEAAKFLPYTECSTLDRRGQLPECQKKNIMSYPTWEFADGSQLLGSLSLSVLAEKTNCGLPQV